MLRKYEGMFLLDPAVTTDWESVQSEVGRLMDRIGARVIASARWDERRLAYEIRGRRRGVYALMYFEADAARIVDLERDAELSDSVLRCLIVRTDHLTEEEMKEVASRPAAPPESSFESDYEDRGPAYRDRDTRGRGPGRAPAASRDDRDRGSGGAGGRREARGGSRGEESAARAADADKPEE